MFVLTTISTMPARRFPIQSGTEHGAALRSVVAPVFTCSGYQGWDKNSGAGE